MEYIFTTKYSNAIEAIYMKHNTKENNVAFSNQKQKTKNSRTHHLNLFLPTQYKINNNGFKKYYQFPKYNLEEIKGLSPALLFLVTISLCGVTDKCNIDEINLSPKADILSWRMPWIKVRQATRTPIQWAPLSTTIFKILDAASCKFSNPRILW